MVQQWYRRYLGRRPDAGGKKTYVGQLEAGAAPIELQARILGSDEFYRRWGSTPGGFINGLYRVVLGQPPARQDVRYWKAQLWRNPDREQLALSFLDTSLEPGSRDEVGPNRRYGYGSPR
jgi:hypothetical protein